MASHYKSVLDHLHHHVTFSYPPQRIISLVPSQTELLFELGLEREVVGITKFCVHPQHWHQRKKIIGGTKNLWFNVIDELRPDLIIGNKEENEQQAIETLQQRYPVWVSDIVSLEDALRMVYDVGSLTATDKKAHDISEKIIEAFKTIKIHTRKKVLYLIWKQPWMAAGAHTFIDTILEKIGLENCVQPRPRYPEISPEEMRQLNPELILLSSEPFPFQEKHKTELQQLLPDAKILLVDGEMFSWYGSRLVKAPQYLNNLDI